jgi:hypothetical protein
MKPFFETELGKLYCGNALDILPCLPKVNLILTDPPYDTYVKYDSYIDEGENWYLLMEVLIPLMLDNADMIIFPATKVKKLQWFYNNFPPDWIISWYKGAGSYVIPIGFNDWEPILVYGKTRNNLGLHDYFYLPGAHKAARWHPCPKPIAWSRWFLERILTRDEVVLDPLAGSGTTPAAAEELGIRWLAIELSKNYCYRIVDRLKKIRRKPSLKKFRKDKTNEKNFTRLPAS